MNLGHLDHVFITQIESGGVVMSSFGKESVLPVHMC